LNGKRVKPILDFALPPCIWFLNHIHRKQAFNGLKAREFHRADVEEDQNSLDLKTLLFNKMACWNPSTWEPKPQKP
jgi:hypothetical protein